MELEDRIVIATPEGLELQLVLAGVGSRFIAAAIDLVLQLLLIVLAALVALALIGGVAGRAVLLIAVFTVFLYDIPFEVLAGGRTPGKRLNHLRVVRDGGGPVNVTASFIRTLLRLIDFLPSAYLVGVTSILISKRNCRLGDLAAGTLVIRDAPRPSKAVAARGGRGESMAAAAGALGNGRPGAHTQPRVDASIWDVSAVSGEEIAAVRRFLQRRVTLDLGPRRELAHRLEQGLRPKVSGAPALNAETFLEALLRAKSGS